MSEAARNSRRPSWAETIALRLGTALVQWPDQRHRAPEDAQRARLALEEARETLRAMRHSGLLP